MRTDVITLQRQIKERNQTMCLLDWEKRIARHKLPSPCSTFALVCWNFAVPLKSSANASIERKAKIASDR